MVAKKKRSRKQGTRKVEKVSSGTSIEGNLNDRFRMVMDANVVLTIAKGDNGHTISLTVGDKVVSLTGITAIGGLSCRSLRDVKKP